MFKLNFKKTVAFLFFTISATSCMKNYISDEEIWVNDYKTITAYLLENEIKQNTFYIEGYGGYIQYRYRKFGYNPNDLPVMLNPHADTTQYVTLNYKVMTLDGLVVDALKTDTTNKEFPLQQLLKGIQIGTCLMTKGDSATVYIPSLYGYGHVPMPNAPANTPLKIDIFLETFEIR